jgi:hypothetical protein
VCNVRRMCINLFNVGQVSCFLLGQPCNAAMPRPSTSWSFLTTLSPFPCRFAALGLFSGIPGAEESSRCHFSGRGSALAIFSTLRFWSAAEQPVGGCNNAGGEVGGCKGPYFLGVKGVARTKFSQNSSFKLQFAVPSR